MNMSKPDFYCHEEFALSQQLTLSIIKIIIIISSSKLSRKWKLFLSMFSREKIVDSHELASHSPLGLNLMEDTAFVCPASVNFRL